MFLELGLALGGGALEEEDGDEGVEEHECSQGIFCAGSEVGRDEGEAAENGGLQVESEDGAAMAETEIGEAVRGVILSRRGERQEAAAGAGDRDECGV